MPPKSQAAAEGPAGPGGVDMAQMMRYLPMLLSVLNHLPGLLFGFLTGLLLLGLTAGRRGFAESVSPVAGHHLVALLVLRELLGPWREGRARAAAARQRSAARRRLASDISMQSHTALD